MVIVFPYGTCAICEGGLPPSHRPSRPRTICDSEECRSAACRYGTARMNAMLARRRAEEGPPTERRCPDCGHTYPLDAEHFHRSSSNPDAPLSRRLDRYCKPCRRTRQRGVNARRTPQQRARRQQTVRERRAQMTTEERAADRAAKAAAAGAWRRRNPEKAREVRRAAWERLKSDPVRHAAYLEVRRVEHRLRQARRRGIPVDHLRTLSSAKQGREDIRKVPAAPLGALIRHLAEREKVNGLGYMGHDATHAIDGCLEAVCARAGVPPRTVLAWATGERRGASFDKADEVLVNLDLLWFEVYDPETFPGIFAWRQRDDVLAWLDAVERAQAAWEGE